MNFPLLTVKKAAEQLGCSSRWIYQQIEKGVITPRYISGKTFLLVEDILAATKIGTGRGRKEDQE